MSGWEALLLGLLQGLTEFLPISSSGHLVLASHLLGVDEPGLLVEVILHAGTLLAVLLFFRTRLFWIISRGIRAGPEGHLARRWVGWLLIGTVPAAAIGLGLRGGVEDAYSSPRLTLLALLGTGVILMSTVRALRREGRRSPLGLPAVIMGLGQALAVLPGISRSGATIAAGLWSGVDRGEAAEFSFLLSVPAIGGATLIHLVEVATGSVPDTGALLIPLAIGFVASAAAGYAAIAGLLQVLQRRGLAPFAWYCWGLGVLGLLLI